MDNQENAAQPRAAIFGASGGIGAAFCNALAADGFKRIYAGSRSGGMPDVSFGREVCLPFTFDLGQEDTLEGAADLMRASPPNLVIVATGALTLPDGSGPERSYKKIDADHMAQVFAVNTIGPAMIAKHMLPLFARDKPCVFAVLSARVGSIGDNNLGGWHSYRASKAALNMLLRNFALELGRTHKNAIVAGLHPGTVDTELSEPFQGNVPDGKLFTPEFSARAMLDVLVGLSPEDSGSVFDWQGKRIPE